MADWNVPVLTTTYTSVLDSLKNRDLDLAVQFSPTYSSPTNIPTGAIRWNPTNNNWEIRTAGGAWTALTSTYSISVTQLNGQAPSYYLDWNNFTNIPATFAPSAHTHDDRYYTETESDARFGNNLFVSGNTIALRTPGNAALSTITVPFATNAGTVAGFSVGQNLLTTSNVTFAGLTLGATTITATGVEINYLSGVTSAIQTQLNGKQATIIGGASTITASNLTASRALASDASGKVAVSAVTATELGYLSGVTSALQTQLNAKANLASPTFTGTVTSPVLRLTTSNDASLASTGHAFQIGSDATENLIIDTNEIQVRTNGVAALLALNAEGGNLLIGNSASTISMSGTVTIGTLGSFVQSSFDAITYAASVTPALSGSNYKTITTTGAMTLNAPAAGWYTMAIRITNGTGAGAITMSGFTKVVGDPFTTTVGDQFLVLITRAGTQCVASVVNA